MQLIIANTIILIMFIVFCVWKTTFLYFDCVYSVFCVFAIPTPPPHPHSAQIPPPHCQGCKNTETTIEIMKNRVSNTQEKKNAIEIRAFRFTIVLKVRVVWGSALLSEWYEGLRESIDGRCECKGKGIITSKVRIRFCDDCAVRPGGVILKGGGRPYIYIYIYTNIYIYLFNH